MNPPGKTAALQRTLAAGGFYTGRIDDDFGPLTQAATLAWAEKNGHLTEAPEPPAPALPPTGLMDARSETTIATLIPEVREIFRTVGIAINAIIAPHAWKWTSGFRSPEEQAALYAAWQNGTGGRAAPPWGSFHQTGLAADGTVFAADGKTPIYEGPDYDLAIAYVTSHASLHLHSGHAYGDDPHVMVWPPSLEDGRSENEVLAAIRARVESGTPIWP